MRWDENYNRALVIQHRTILEKKRSDKANLLSGGEQRMVEIEDPSSMILKLFSAAYLATVEGNKFSFVPLRTRGLLKVLVSCRGFKTGQDSQNYLCGPGGT